MRNSSIKTLALIAGTAIFLTGCGLGKMIKKFPEVTKSVSPDPLETHGGKVAVTITGKFPASYFHKKATVTVEPVLKYEGGETPLKTMTLLGESVEGDGKKIGYASGGSFSHTDTIPYQEAMKKSDLVVTFSASLGTKTPVELGTDSLAKGTIITSTRVQNDEDVLLGGDKYVKENPITQKGEIFFPIQQAEITGKEKNSTSIKELKDFAKEGYTTKNIDITSWASPDGPIELNDNLSNNRAKNTFGYIKGELKKLKLEGAESDELYTKTSKGEHWEGFQKLVGASDMEDKQLILDIVGRHSDVNKREQEIKNLAVIYLKLAKDILPKLRKSEIIINSLEPKKTDAEMDSLAIAAPDSLDAEELLYAATLTEDMNKKLKIFESYTKVYPDDWRGFNNIAFIYMKQDNLEEASSFLITAKEKKMTAEVLNNLGVISAWNKDYDQAKIYFEDAKSNGGDEGNNLGILHLKTGKYQEALEYFGNDCSYSAALTYLLIENTEQAIQKLDCEEKSASAFYLKAIAGARTGDSEMLTSNLKKAIEKDAFYRREAMVDLEFAKFWGTQEFKNAIQ
ncbi:MAG: tetratricopeptide repeat protein [Bacteroidota bacterium]